MLTALVIDDELFAREELIALLTETNQVDVLAQASNAIEGLKLINQLKPDVVFLDVEMPQVSGIELVSMLDPERMPYIVFVTAYDQYAIQAFDDNVFDYLLKPINACRLNKSINRLLKMSQLHHISTKHPITPVLLDQIPCTGLNRIMPLNIIEVEYAFSDLSGVHIKTKNQCATSLLTLKLLEERTALVRCHRQYLINLKSIKEIKLLDNGLAKIVTDSGNCIPVSRRYLKPLKEQFGLNG